MEQVKSIGWVMFSVGLPFGPEYDHVWSKRWTREDIPCPVGPITIKTEVKVYWNK